uniref:Uncharacterized protein n=1 Tax=Podoviridae sp. ctrTt13 TaxID=2825279 RepID=A0A8S5NSS0_9CAUD|nr:MAG TPA: hypothetical protein [Podoviridae sp. ctrTt13]
MHILYFFHSLTVFGKNKVTYNLYSDKTYMLLQ